MASCVRNAVKLLHLPLPEAVRMASFYPAEFLGLAHQTGRIRAGYRANLVLADEELHVVETWVDGRTSAEDGLSP
jgi:N-acetylglucosamine-6-phosphate deacetylase